MLSHKHTLRFVDSDAIRARLAARIREACEAQDLPIVRLADRAGVSRGYIWSVLRGDKGATIDYVAQLAEALGYDPGALLGSKPITRRTPRVKVVAASEQ
jgi:transcriptional regulator with XRE-family HTH domain